MTTPEGEPTTEETTGSPGIMVYRIGGHVYPHRVRAGCLVCTSDYRLQIEREIAAGRRYQSIVDDLPEGTGIEAKTLSSHFRGNHMPLRQAAVRRIVEDRQIELGKAIEDGADLLADHVALARVVVQRSFADIAAGRIRPTVSDGIAAAKILQQTGVNDEETDKAAYVEAFVVYMETAQQMMSAEQFAAFGKSLQSNPVLKALVARHQQQSQTPV